jgi:hypothetical protein
MPCPFYSKADNECTLLVVAPVADDDQPEQDEPEPEVVDRNLCLDRHGAHRGCAIFTRRAIEQTRAY